MARSQPRHSRKTALELRQRVSTRVKKPLEYWSTTWRLPKKITPPVTQDGSARRQPYFICNVTGCEPRGAPHSWRNMSRHMEMHGKPKAAVKNPAIHDWTCETCRDCPCHGSGHVYTCAKKNKRRHELKCCRKEHRNDTLKDTDYSQDESDQDSESDTSSEVEQKDPQDSGQSSDSDVLDPGNTQGQVVLENNEHDVQRSAGSALDGQSGTETINTEASMINLERDLYWADLQNAHKECIVLLQQLQQEWIGSEKDQKNGPRMNKKNRIEREVSIVLDAYRSCAVEKPLLLDEYSAGRSDGTIDDDSPVLLFLSADQATEFLRDGQPRVSVVVPASLDPRSRRLMSLDNMLNKLEGFGKLSVHDYEARRDDVQPMLIEAQDLVKRFREKKGIVNLLEMNIPIANPVPSFIVELPGWDLLQYTRDDQSITKTTGPTNSDFSNQISFQLLAMSMAWSLWHHDEGGSVTTVRVESGDKLWLSSASRTLEDLKILGWSGKPNGKTFQIYLRQGDTLVQPAGTPHMPLTGPFHPICLMSGTQHYPSQNICAQIDTMLAQAWSLSQSTNEYPKDITSKMKWWMQMMDKDICYPWPSQDEQTLFKERVQEWYRYANNEYKGCKCVSVCKPSHCGCLQRDMLCSPRCHSGRAGQKKRKWPTVNANHKGCAPFDGPYFWAYDSEAGEGETDEENGEDKNADDKNNASLSTSPRNETGEITTPQRSDGYGSPAFSLFDELTAFEADRTVAPQDTLLHTPEDFDWMVHDPNA